MDAVVREQIMEIRDSGRTNMLDVNAVMRIALDEGFYELVEFLLNHKKRYVRFIFTGEDEEESI